MLEASARLLRLLSLLQSRRDWSGAELAARLEVTDRTIRHDIHRLRQLGYAVDATPGVAGGYRLGTASVVPPMLLDDDETVAVAVGLRAAASSPIAGLEAASIRALAKVHHLMPAALQQRASALHSYTVSTPSLGPSVDAEVLVAIASVCRDSEQLHFHYRNHDGAEGLRTVEPHRVVTRGARWYLVAWDLRSSAWRTFRVDRIDLATNHRGARFTPRALPDQDLAGYVERGFIDALWQQRATVIVYASATEIRRRVPPIVTVEAIDQHRCRVNVGSSSPQMLAAYLAMLNADFQFEEASDVHGLVEALRTIADRFRTAAQHAGPRDPADLH